MYIDFNKFIIKHSFWKVNIKKKGFTLFFFLGLFLNKFKYFIKYTYIIMIF